MDNLTTEVDNVDRYERFDEWQDASYVHLIELGLEPGERSGTSDARDAHDLVWPSNGVLQVETASGPLLATPTRAVWVPAPERYVLEARQPLRATILSFFHGYCPCPIGRPGNVDLGGIAGEVSTYLALPPASDAARYHAERLLLACLADALRPPLPLPTDDRARRVAEALLADPSDVRTLREWGAEVGASARTLARAFARETGSTFPAWRRAVRLEAAESRLASGEPLASVAHAVGYAAPGSFAAARGRART